MEVWVANQYSRVFDNLRNAASSAFDQGRKMTGHTTDHDLMLYNSLNEHSLSAIAGKYGVENTIRYIQQMEAKRMKEGNNA
jgi:hypothetical protein